MSHYFDLHTKSYFQKVMRPAFGVSAYWYRQEFAKSRGMIHWHGLCWRQDKEPHNLFHEAIKSGLGRGRLCQRDIRLSRILIWDECTTPSRKRCQKSESVQNGIWTKDNPGKELRDNPAIVKDKKGYLRQE